MNCLLLGLYLNVTFRTRDGEESVAHTVGIQLPQAGYIFREILGQLRILANTVSAKGLYLAWPLYSECHHYKKVQTDALALNIFPLRLVGKENVHSGGGNLLTFYSEMSWLT